MDCGANLGFSGRRWLGVEFKGFSCTTTGCRPKAFFPFNGDKISFFGFAGVSVCIWIGWYPRGGGAMLMKGVVLLVEGDWAAGRRG